MKKGKKSSLMWILVILIAGIAVYYFGVQQSAFAPVEIDCIALSGNILDCTPVTDKVDGASEYTFQVHKPKLNEFSEELKNIIILKDSWFRSFFSRNTLKEQIVLNLRFNTADTYNKYSINGESCKPNDCNGAVESYDEGCGLYKADASYSKSLCGQYGCDARSTYQESLCSQIGGTFSYSGNIFYCRNAFTTCGGKIYSSPFELSYMPYQISDKVYPAFYEFPIEELTKQLVGYECIFSGNVVNRISGDNLQFYFNGITRLRNNDVECYFNNIIPKKLDQDDWELRGKIQIDFNKKYAYTECFQNMDCGDETALSSLCKTDGKYITYNRPSCIQNKCTNTTAEIKVGECPKSEHNESPIPLEKDNSETMLVIIISLIVVTILILAYYLLKKY